MQKRRLRKRSLRRSLFLFAIGKPLENEKHELFCLEYLARGRNGVRAYQAVYPGTTYMSACAGASRLLSDVKIQTRIKELHEEQVARLKATADEVLFGLSAAMHGQ